MARRAAKLTAASGPVDGPWALPEGWRWERLGDLGAWSGGGTPSKARADYWTDGTIPWVSPKDMKRFTIDSTEDHITRAAVGGSSAKIVPAGSVLCVMRSGILRHTFPVAVAGVDVSLNQDMRALTLPRSISPKYLAYYLRFSGQTVLDTASKGGTTVNSVEASALDRHPVPLPDRRVQDDIVARIEDLFADLDDGEEELRRARSDLQMWRKALLKAAVTGELTADWRAANPPTETGADLLAGILADRGARWLADPRSKGKRYVEPAGPDTSDMPELPPGWIWASVAQLGEVTGGITKNGKRDSHALRLPYLRVGNVYDSRLDLSRVESIGLAESEVARISLQEGDLLIVEGNGSLDQIGRAAIWTGEIEPCVHQNHLIKVRPEVRILSDLILTWLRSLGGRKELEARASSTSGLHTLSVSKVEALRCPLPPLNEIREILTRLDDELGACSEALLAEEGARTTSATLRQSILSAAFRGEFVQ